MTEKPYSFGIKPEELPGKDEEVGASGAGTGNPAEGTAGEGQGSQTEEAKWLEDFNKTFKTTYKTPKEIEPILASSQKIAEYETQIGEWKKNEENYKKQINDLQSSLTRIKNPLSYFSSPESFVAEQLKRQHPDKNPIILQEVVTGDIKKWDDLDVLVKNALLENPDLEGGEEGARETICQQYGIEAGTSKEEWSVAVRNRLKMEANAIRRQWDGLKQQIELPKVLTPEEEEAEVLKSKEAKLKELAPLKEKFRKFDEFSIEVEPGKNFKFIVPDDYKSSLDAMFDGYFVEAGMDATPENQAAIEKLRAAIMLLEHFDKVYKVIETDVQARERAERDKLLNNNTAHNTGQASDDQGDSAEKISKMYGFGKYLGKI